MRDRMHYNIQNYMQRYNVSAADVLRYRHEATTSVNANRLAAHDSAALAHIHDVLHCVRMTHDLALLTRSHARRNRRQQHKQEAHPEK